DRDSPKRRGARRSYLVGQQSAKITTNWPFRRGQNTSSSVRITPIYFHERPQAIWASSYQWLSPFEQPVAEEIVEFGDGVNFVGRHLRGIFNTVIPHFVAIEHHVARTRIAI